MSFLPTLVRCTAPQLTISTSAPRLADSGRRRARRSLGEPPCALCLLRCCTDFVSVWSFFNATVLPAALARNSVSDRSHRSFASHSDTHLISRAPPCVRQLCSEGAAAAIECLEPDSQVSAYRRENLEESQQESDRYGNCERGRGGPSSYSEEKTGRHRYRRVYGRTRLVGKGDCCVYLRWWRAQNASRRSHASMRTGSGVVVTKRM